MKARWSITVAWFLVIMLALATGGAQASQTSNINRPNSNSPDTRWAVDYLSTNPDAGGHTSVAVDDDNVPWIAYYNDTYGSLMVAHYVGAGNGNCNEDDAWLCDQVDQAHAQSRGLYTSIDTFPDINPNPVLSTWKVGVSYYDASNKSLKYADYSCNLLNGCAWEISTVDSSEDENDDVGKYTSLKFDADGVPHISYHMYNVLIQPLRTYSVKHATFVGSGSGDCGDDNNWACETVDSAPLSLGTHTSLDIDWSGNLYISYYDGFKGALKYAYYAGIGNCGEGDTWLCQVIDSKDSEDIGKFSSFHAAQNQDDSMRVAYYNSTAGALMYAYDIDGTGNCGETGGWQCTEIDKMGAGLTQAAISLAVDENNLPMITYTDGHEELAPLGLKVASAASGMPYANCGGDLLYDFYCRTIDNGGDQRQEAQYAGLAIKSNGLAFIAYSELNEYEYPSRMALKITYQTSRLMLPMIIR